MRSLFLTLNILSLSVLSSYSATTEYYTIMNGVFETNIWSKASHTGATCTCTPGCAIPANSIIYISHAVTSNCTNLDIGSNSTLVIQPGGSLTVNPGNGNITGTGTLIVEAGGTLNISGDLNLSGSGGATINGTVNVGGNINFSGAANMCGNGYVAVGGSVNGGSPCPTIILPIELLSFDAVIISETTVELQWSTATETHNDYFTIQRSFDGKIFTDLMIVDGAGTSTQQMYYLEQDTDPLPGVGYYRLKQTDFDGSYTYSEIRVVNRQYNGEIPEITVFPNPTDGDIFNLEFSGFDNEEVLVMLHDAQGKVFHSKMYLVHDSNQLIGVDLEDRIPPGVYVITASSDNKVLSKKLIVK
jgi:hypothetical protein